MFKKIWKGETMKIKIMKSRDSEKLEKEYNDFCEKHNVRYTQSHIGIQDDEVPLKYLFVYYDDNENKNTQTIRKLVREKW